MRYASSLDKRIEEQNQKKNKPKTDDEPDDMDILLERQRMTALNMQKSVFDTDTGNNTPGINTAPSVFEKTAVFRSSEGGPK